MQTDQPIEREKERNHNKQTNRVKHTNKQMIKRNKPTYKQSTDGNKQWNL